MNFSSHLSVPHIDMICLDKLAEIAVKVGLNIQDGQSVIITAPIESLPLTRLITKHAYLSGAGLVSIFYTDEETTLIRYQYSNHNGLSKAADWLYKGMAQAYSAGTARLAISGSNPVLLADQDPDKIMRVDRAYFTSYKPALEKISNFDINWSIISYPSASWARVVYPDDPEPIAIAKLAKAIFAISRANVDDPIEAWKKHNNFLHKRAKLLNDKHFSEIHFIGPGTFLKVGLVDGHLWQGGSSTAKNGVICNTNIPTEEVFTTPHKLKVEGYVSSTKPLSYQGTLIDGIRVRFEEGRVVEAKALKNEAIFLKMLGSDSGACRLGEVALVPNSSLVSKTGILFYNTLFDENASSHIAFGQCYAKCFMNNSSLSSQQIEEQGGNTSIIHVDWMIGSNEIDVNGITKDGNSIPVMRKGEWVD
ncbi:Aminopeptidase S (Leu, Val, Phe, Tyr preference) [Liberibacter crescens BT-1]|uniref:Aminopeptidase S (Leu, Val, Phe, Tyr preference) n=1 Tax=Liberibacter crescens (strain BT-1) TaxID=1215343 RepID=L0EUH5_LIBCB|nr:aminopeptidase [Liberibacter crescens]AGA64016.1 Aminopeptidase S (Leu, Val, Phe, Tyr preference) [Liberibacter crescens BT-1]AMC12325.1 peptidase M29 [Liberibacter crescens]